MKDFVDQELAIGDVVFFRMPHYSDICVGRVKSFTEKQVRLEYANTWNYRHDDGRYMEYMYYPSVMLKAVGPQLMSERVTTALANLDNLIANKT